MRQGRGREGGGVVELAGVRPSVFSKYWDNHSWSRVAALSGLVLGWGWVFQGRVREKLLECREG